MLKIILLLAALAGTFYMFAVPGTPLHAFLHPVHLTVLDIAGQAAYAVVVWCACIWIGSKLPFLD